MSIDANEYARLSNDSYNDRSQEKNSNKTVSIGGIDYKILDVTNDPKTGYQGTAYQRMDTGEVVIAHRGTEPDAKDIKADAGMVFNGRNSQLDGAVAFTERAMARARETQPNFAKPIAVSITGHSLGGTLAEITAAKYSLHAETFNAYGPKDLADLKRYGVDVHAQHPNIVNHVRATDVVGAGAPHLGQVKIYAAQQDIESLRHGRYIGGSQLPGNPLLAADVAAHSITNFLPGNEALGESVMNAANEARARAYAGPIAQYRHDVMKGRIDLRTVADHSLPPIPTASGLRLGVQAADAASTVAAEKATQAMLSGAQAVGYRAQAVGDATGQAYDATSTAVVHAAKATGKAVASGAQAASNAAERAYDATRDSVITGAQRAGQALQESGQKIRDDASRAIGKLTRPWLHSQTEAAPLLNQPEHPGNGFYKQSLAGLEKINAERGIPSDHRTCNAAGTLAAGACQSGFRQIDHVVLNEDGSKLIAVQGKLGSAHSKVIDVDTMVALNTPLAQSSQAFVDAQNQQQNQRLQQANQPVQTQAAPVLS
ncbi:XVIPCD domain-containing protein [Variovorax sp. CCNWLW225]|uniref:XVIPCD domain-containing protein n=1 Tax=Variovorax sp. CCNWLW225 TaxID=3127462 RepID=UPI003077A591